MNSFFLEYRDPLFSVIIFFVFVFLITFVSYWWGRYRATKENKNIDKFLKQFYSEPSSDDIKVLVQGENLSEKSWLILADAYSQNGEYEKSIEIYTDLLKSTKSLNSKELLFLMGSTYFKAGFLQRAKTVFLEILQKHPRTPKALQYLLLVYENMRDYKSAYEVLEPLDELEQDTSTQDTYLKIMIVLNDTTLSTEQKADELIKLYNETNKNTHLVFEYLFKVNAKKAWKSFDGSKCEEVVDILWLVDTKDLNLDIITKDAYLKELYTARGDLNLSKSSDIFEFDVLINLHSKANATLSFEYVCDSCKQVSPFAFHRCSKCHSVDSSNVEMSLIKDYYRNFSEENNSFQ